MDWQLFVSTFVLIFLAELPDKTAFASLLLASRGNPAAVFAGAALALLIQSAVAVFLGSLITALPERAVHVGAGITFLFFALQMWRQRNEEIPSESDESASHRSFLAAATAAFTVVFVAEWGDLTQILTATLQAKFNQPVTIFFASLGALWSVSLIGIGLGVSARKYIKPRILRTIAVFVFTAIGSWFLISSLYV